MTDTLLEGLQETGAKFKQADIIAMPITDFALILTQKEYPFHRLPESWAVAAALCRDLAVRLMEKDEFTIQLRESNAEESRLVGWLIENPKRFED